MQQEETERPATVSGRRIDEVFGRDLGTEHRGWRGTDDGTPSDEDRARELWYRENRPPHHDHGS